MLVIHVPIPINVKTVGFNASTMELSKLSFYSQFFINFYNDLDRTFTRSRESFLLDYFEFWLTGIDPFWVLYTL